ncbi:hypothetical protein [Colwellia hornerae]|uniref:hypothetical protein n=1 Tax=Colwellia hornerae TaxID=89402 RepID=UPI0014791AD9|nr:hypothetical protein [Colwellia hornerae]
MPVKDIYKLGGRYFIVATYGYFDKKSQEKLDGIFEEKNIDAEALRRDMLSFYQPSNQ